MYKSIHGDNMVSDSWDKSIKNSVDKQLDGFINWKAVSFSKNNYQYRSSPVNCENLKELDLIIGYNSNLEMYIAWNALAHNRVNEHLRRETKKHTFAVNHYVADEIIRTESGTDIFPIYYSPNSWGYNGERAYEKALIIKPSGLFRFCEDPFAYLMPDPTDSGYSENTLYASPEHKEQYVVASTLDDNYIMKTRRERIVLTQAKRNPNFRKMVFEKYDPPHCVVCGETTEELLEAAHYVAVKDGGADTAENGLCLCIIHHKLFDAEMIDIDLQDKSFLFNKEYVAKSLCFEAGKKYSFK